MHIKSILLAVALAFYPSFPALAEEPSRATISVSGTGKAEAAPDMALLQIGVVREAETARQALDANNAAMARVLEALENEGVEKSDLQTSGLNIQPRYVYPKASSDGRQIPPRIVGYTVSNNLDVRILEIAKTGALLDMMVSLGVNTGGNIQFSNQDTASLLTKARADAVAKAIAKAQTLAEAAGVELGNIISINEGHSAARPLPIAQARNIALAEASAVPIATGENVYRVQVNIVWEIDQ